MQDAESDREWKPSTPFEMLLDDTVTREPRPRSNDKEWLGGAVCRPWSAWSRGGSHDFIAMSPSSEGREG